MFEQELKQPLRSYAPRDRHLSDYRPATQPCLLGIISDKKTASPCQITQKIHRPAGFSAADVETSDVDDSFSPRCLAIIASMATTKPA